MRHRPASMFHQALVCLAGVVVRPMLERAHPHGIQLRGLRMLFGAITAAASLGREPASITVVDEFTADGALVVGEWVRGAGCVRRDRAILYLHGGGYISTGAAHYRGIAARLSALTGLGVFVVDYRLAPEHPHPAALSDALAAYDWLTRSGIDTAVVGDSAGAHLSVGLTVETILAGGRVPRALALFSPLLDVSCRRAEQLDVVSPDPLMSPRFARRCGETLGVDADTSDPRLAVLAADGEILSRFPPTVSIVGGTECFREDAGRLHSQLLAHGIASQTHEMPGHIHDFVLFTRTRSARAALRTAADVLAAHTDSAADPCASPPTRPAT